MPIRSICQLHSNNGNRTCAALNLIFVKKCTTYFHTTLESEVQRYEICKLSDAKINYSTVSTRKLYNSISYNRNLT